MISTSIWGLFIGFCSSSSGTLSAGAGFILQVKYPHEALLIKQTAQQLANFLITFAETIIFLIIFGVFPNWKIILLPFLILPLFLLGAGIGLIISVYNIIATDLQKGFDILTYFIFFITPVIYSPNVSSPLLKKITHYNPLTYLICGIRDIVIYGKYDYFDRFMYASILSLIIFIFSWRLFYVSEDKVIEKLL
jgi:lipopolysaccharide transport system permease protein